MQVTMAESRPPCSGKVQEGRVPTPTIPTPLPMGRTTLAIRRIATPSMNLPRGLSHSRPVLSLALMLERPKEHVKTRSNQTLMPTSL